MYTDLYFEMEGMWRRQNFNKVFFVKLWIYENHMFVSRSAVAVQTFDLPRANLVPQFFRVRVYPQATFYSLSYKGTFARRANLLGQ